MSGKPLQGGAASSASESGKLTGTQKKALTVLSSLLDHTETLRSLERDAAVDLSVAIGLLLAARGKIIEKFDL